MNRREFLQASLASAVLVSFPILAGIDSTAELPIVTTEYLPPRLIPGDPLAQRGALWANCTVGENQYGLCMVSPDDWSNLPEMHKVVADELITRLQNGGVIPLGGGRRAAA